MPSSRSPFAPTPDLAGRPAPGLAAGGGPAEAPASIELPDFSTHPHVPSPSDRTAVPFTASVGADAVPAPVFEVSATAGVPEALLAPARDAARAAGYAAGWAHGVRAARLVSDAEAQAARTARERAETEAATAVSRALAALAAAATDLEARAVPAAHEIEGLIVSAALEIAEALVGTVLRDDATRSQAALTRALALAPAGEDVTVALSPADYAAVGGTEYRADRSRSVTLTEDAALAPGDATATCGATTIDARLSAGLARVRELL